jgi:hypothetical protein
MGEDPGSFRLNPLEINRRWRNCMTAATKAAA